MKNLSLTFCLGIAALLGSVGGGSALPKCKGSPTSNWKMTKTWNDCEGVYNRGSQHSYVGEWKNGRLNGRGIQTVKTQRRHFRYVGDWRNNKRHGQGILIYSDGTIEEGIWKNDKFLYAQKTPYSKKTVKPSVLRTAFIKLSTEKRKQIQSNLKDLGFYKSSIDGLYGKGTVGALKTYNKQNLNELDLNNSENVVKLINAVLGLKPAPEPKPDVNSDNTYKVASGSGFYVSNEGHIITNHHVIEGCEDMKVHSKGNVLETKRIAEDRRNDLALLKTTKSPKHSFALSTESPFPLQEIIVAGYPFGEKVSSTLKFTQGIVSSIAGLGNDYSQIQIDAAIQPGNSGGPILDEYGNVVAVAVAKLSLKKILKDYGVVPENTNFGVKASAVRNLMEGNGVSFKSPNTEVISKRELSQVATDGTVYLTCWMTTAQIEQMRARKVLFEDLE
jgi:S1-C subfamily serine protease